jgi:hypothetical protein
MLDDGNRHSNPNAKRSNGSCPLRGIPATIDREVSAEFFLGAVPDAGAGKQRWKAGRGGVGLAAVGLVGGALRWCGWWGPGGGGG